MSVAKLNVEIAARLDGLQKGLKEAERSLATWGRKMQAAGDNMLSTLSAPLGALGALSIKAAGDFEAMGLALSTTMVDAGRSTAAAATEMEALRKAALAPGLDFKQAIQASMRLQNVGYSAEQARKIITELANAITMSGGTAEDLDGVTRQFSQMISKGRILQEDLTIISERMPKIAELSKKAFGTASAEALREKGINAQQFVAGITVEMEKLKRVEGGISNAIVNAGSAVTQFLGVVGMEINKTFNLNKLANDFSQWLGDMGRAFQGLDAPTKRAILSFGAVVVAVGPVLKVIGMLTSTVGSLVGTGAMVVGWARTASGAVVGAVQAFQALNAVTRSLLVAGGIVSLGLAVGALIVYLAKMNREVTASEHAARAMGEVHAAAANSMAGEKVAAERLVKTLTDETMSRERKKAALEQLQAIAPAYFQNLKLEKSSVEEINAALAKYIEFIQKRATLTAANEKLVEVEKRLLDVETRRQDATASWGQTAVNFSKEVLANVSGLGYFYSFNNAQQKTAIDNYGKEEAALNAQKAALAGKISELTKEGVTMQDVTSATSLFSDALKKTTTTAAATKEAVKEVSEKTSAYKEVLESISAAVESGKVFGDEEAWNRQAEAIGKGIDTLLSKGFSSASVQVTALIEKAKELKGLVGGPLNLPEIDRKTGLSPVSSMEGVNLPELKVDVAPIREAESAVMSYTEKMRELGQVNESFMGGMMKFGETWQIVASIVNESGTLIERMSVSAAESMMEVAAKGGTSFKELAMAAVGSAAKVVRAWIMQGVASVVSKALSSMPFPLNLAIAGGAGAAAGVLFNKALGALKIPALAEGGVLRGPSMVLAGEYPGASVNPEVIAPLDKLQDMIAPTAPVVVGGTIRASGKDLLVVLDAARQWDNRIR